MKQADSLPGSPAPTLWGCPSTRPRGPRTPRRARLRAGPENCLRNEGQLRSRTEALSWGRKERTGLSRKWCGVPGSPHSLFSGRKHHLAYPFVERMLWCGTR